MGLPVSATSPTRADAAGIGDFLADQPGLRVLPSSGGAVRLEGQFAFHADFEGGPAIRDTYHLRIEVPTAFPDALPFVYELGGRIPRDLDHHVFPQSGRLCLGSTLRLHAIARDTRGLLPFGQRAIVPYLYAASLRERTGGPYPFGELAHDRTGLLDDYAQMLNLERPEQAAQALALGAMRKRLANKRPCPCGCGQRLGVCPYRKYLNAFRNRFGRPVIGAVYRQAVGAPSRRHVRTGHRHALTTHP